MSSLGPGGFWMKNHKGPLPVCKIMGVQIAVTDMKKTLACI